MSFLIDFIVRGKTDRRPVHLDFVNCVAVNCEEVVNMCKLLLGRQGFIIIVHLLSAVCLS